MWNYIIVNGFRTKGVSTPNPTPTATKTTTINNDFLILIEMLVFQQLHAARTTTPPTVETVNEKEYFGALLAPLMPTVTVSKELGTGVPATQVVVTVHDYYCDSGSKRGSREPVNHEGDGTSQNFFVWLKCTTNSNIDASMLRIVFISVLFFFIFCVNNLFTFLLVL